ncbi:putative pentatricopeptide repeat-containing protein At5g43820 isoform X1 [Dendrobium catenatum]|uniref:Pentatricopeptide repeat-containing protein n=2 Tax=Dendrobium catenatum TaxID=906689 RepID=A0A2I0WUI8_9ASPA|nr:putative pentatricopeptide repeat-containing protein At5g43820 isoform X1 [Dendrobium catenatum]PKU79328.1 Putative pentatricopeptide repeat-containing protein [Dendrobium catenatum]
MASGTLTRYHNLLRVSIYPLPHSFTYCTSDLSQQSIFSPKSQEIPSKHETTLSEQFVLEELSSILPIGLKTTKSCAFTLTPMPEPQLSKPSNCLLLPDEKLRGIFLQKVSGKYTLESALSATGVNLTPEIFSDVLNKGSMGGAAMVAFFNWALGHSDLPKNIETYNLVLKALGKRKFFDFMVEVSLRMRKDELKPDLGTIEIILDSFVRARQVSKAVDFFKRLEDIGADCDTKALNILLKCLCTKSHVGVASSLLNSMKGKIPFNELTYNEIIAGWAKFGMVDKVEKYWAAMAADNFSPDCRTFCHLIEALGRAGRIGKAAETFDKIEEKGCIPDTSIYNVMISNCISAGDIEEAVNYYKRMTERKCSPDIDTYSKLIKAFLKARRVADALEFFNEMLGRGLVPTVGMVTSFIEPLCNFGPPHAAMVIYKNAMKLGCRVSLKAYKLLFMRLARCGKGGMLLKLWEEMQESGYTLDNEVYDCIINGLCNVGHVETAVLIVNEALRHGCCPGRIVYSKLNNKLLAMSKVETAYKLFLKVRDARNNQNLQSYWRSRGWHF